ncbi:alanine racemase [Glaciecola petra]|uniref:Alanine racemase n=1 Tax=Glaciecola petra TaxID=3075602 RepID=A0ABU2ZVB0_9ALTE|nr:alanine racemase [Aestuariibacter sp. P117]MDT0595357.1 alanine racemase [Aestuariibacter sp. P117]
MSRPTSAFIDLSALKENLKMLSELHQKNADGSQSVGAKTPKIIAVVKANAYGNGAIEVAQAIESRVDLLAIAFAHEALELREAGITKPILVLQGPHQLVDLSLTFSHNLYWMLHTDWQAEALSAFFAEQNKSSQTWFKFDTGMHRLGFGLDDFDRVQHTYKSLWQANTVVCSHLACADEVIQQHAQQQIDKFLQNVEDSDYPRCIANSATHVRFTNARQDYVRLGIAMYGSTPFTAEDSPITLAPVMHFESQIIALRTIPKGDAVGYGATWQAKRESVIATVALGYADGYPRHAPTGTPAYCNGQTIPLVGRVSMDMLTFDVTDLTAVAIGDTVQLWGDKMPINQVADHVGTIGYELMTRVSARVPRVYKKK